MNIKIRTPMLVRPVGAGLSVFLAALLLTISACKNSTVAEEEGDPAEVAIGERLFKETRFAQFFASHSNGNVNAALAQGDPAVQTSETTGTPLSGPFAGQSMNCSACHLVDQQLAASGDGMRTYADFARRSPIPARNDSKTLTVRNSPPLVNATLARDGGLLLHFDGEFPTLQGLIAGTLTGRNFGWLPGEAAQAIAQVAKIVREDNGNTALDREFGGSYRQIFAGLSPDFQLPVQYRLDVATASDQQIFDAVTQLITVYVDQLRFVQNDAGDFIASPYDFFLRQNRLPAAPAVGETAKAYARRLRNEIDQRSGFSFIDGNQGGFLFHNQEFRFGPDELAGLKAFLAEPQAALPTSAELAAGGIGNCIACHAPPAFTDSGLHNTGISQREYETMNGAGSFAALVIPGLTARQAAPQLYLPATAAHPAYAEPFRAIPTAGQPQLADLGVWNIFANPDFPGSQAMLRDFLCRNGSPCDDSSLLNRAIASFKTPGLRDLGHSGPFMHNGTLDTLEQAAGTYRNSSDQARAGNIRNADPEMRRIALQPADVNVLAAFLRSLNEDYN